MSGEFDSAFALAMGIYAAALFLGGLALGGLLVWWLI